MSLVLYFFLVSPLETILSKVFFLSLTDLAEVRLRSVTYFFSQDSYTAIVVLSSSLLIFCFVINNTTYHLMLYFFFFESDKLTKEQKRKIPIHYIRSILKYFYCTVSHGAEESSLFYVASKPQVILERYTS